MGLDDHWCYVLNISVCQALYQALLCQPLGQGHSVKNIVSNSIKMYFFLNSQLKNEGN